MADSSLSPVELSRCIHSIRTLCFPIRVMMHRHFPPSFSSPHRLCPSFSIISLLNSESSCYPPFFDPRFHMNPALAVIRSTILPLEIVFLEGTPLFPSCSLCLIAMYRRVGIGCFRLPLVKAPWSWLYRIYE